MSIKRLAFRHGRPRTEAEAVPFYAKLIKDAVMGRSRTTPRNILISIYKHTPSFDYLSRVVAAAEEELCQKETEISDSSSVTRVNKLQRALQAALIKLGHQRSAPPEEVRPPSVIDDRLAPLAAFGEMLKASKTAQREEERNKIISDRVEHLRAEKLKACRSRVAVIRDELFSYLAEAPLDAVANLWLLTAENGQTEAERTASRQADIELISYWKIYRPKPRLHAKAELEGKEKAKDIWHTAEFPAAAARAAEHLTIRWLKARYKPVFDLSVRQVRADEIIPASVATVLSGTMDGRPIPSGRHAFKADMAAVSDKDITLFDTKNTVRSQRRMVTLLLEKERVIKLPVTYVATWTDGQVDFDEWGSRQFLCGEKESRRATKTIPRLHRSALARVEQVLRKVSLNVLGELNRFSLDQILEFARNAAPDISLPGAKAKDEGVEPTNLDRLPSFLFCMPEEAYPERGKRRSRAMRLARRVALDTGSLPAFILAAVSSGSFPDASPDTRLSDERRKFAERFAKTLLLREDRRKHLPPSVGEVYIIALQLLIEAVNSSSDNWTIGPLIRLPDLLNELFLDHERRFPLGAWDPVGIMELSINAARSLARNVQTLGGLSHIYRLTITKKGTVIAVGAANYTLISHCICGEWPLVRGAAIPGSNEPNGCSVCGMLLCEQRHGCEDDPWGYGEWEGTRKGCLAARLAGISDREG